MEFLTNKDFLAKVELSLSLRFNWEAEIKRKEDNHKITNSGSQREAVTEQSREREAR